MSVDLGRHRELAGRFWSKVDKDGPVPPMRLDLGPCWIWLGGKSHGYGVFAPRYQEHYRAHRFAYELLVGEIPASKRDMDHLCRNPSCVNPRHLEPVTHAENCRRGAGFSGRNHQKTRCDAGHLLVGDNLYVDPKGRRQCKACRARASREERKRSALTRPVVESRRTIERKARDAEIQRLVESGLSKAEVARRLGVSYQTVFNALHRAKVVPLLRLAEEA